MNRKQLYAQLLLDDRWKNKRLKILKRDNYTCRHCRSKNNLHVHHLIYKVGGVPPWEYRNSDLITLCANCHDEVHRTKKIKSIGKNGNNPTKSRKEKINAKIERMKSKLSTKDNELQKRYDRINSRIR